MKITALEEYGLRCLLQLARSGKLGLSISEIAKREGLSTEYVSKITAILRKGSLIASKRGLKGGYYLTHMPHEITLSQVQKVLGDMLFGDQFCGQHAGQQNICVHEENCSVRSVWSVVDKYIGTIMEQVTIADLLNPELIARKKIEAVVAASVQHGE